MMKKSQQGFTLIELMIATVIFTFILLIATAGIIRIGELYSKGINQSRTQESLRGISDEITRAVQFADGTKVPDPAVVSQVMVDRYCIGDTVYTVYFDQPFKQNSNASLNNPTDNQTGLWAERLSDGVSCECVLTSCGVDEVIQLLGENMRVLRLDVSQLGSTVKAWKANISIAYGDDDLLTHFNDDGTSVETIDTLPHKTRAKTAGCKSGVAGSQFCAIAQQDTVVKKRLN